MIIKQFEDKNLAHYAYAIISKGEMALIDPSRNPQMYYDFAKEEGAKIIAVIETHPHADFISSHLEIHKQLDATIYVSKYAGAEYPHEGFDDDEAIVLGNIVLKAINTPGHSPDSISILAIDEEGKPKAIFSGDTLFIGDCGRPDLREEAGAITASRSDLAKAMYHTLRDKYMNLEDEIQLYPAHGAGSLCGKGLSENAFSTIGEEKRSNWSLGNISEEDFVTELLKEQPMIPAYFPYDVEINKKGAIAFSESISKVKRREPVSCVGCANALNPAITMIDTRPESEFKKSHLKGSINLMNGNKFETWLGSIVEPGEAFYLIAENEDVLTELIQRIAKIGYESQILLAFVFQYGNSEMEKFDSQLLKGKENEFTIVDIRSLAEIQNQKIFSESIHIPLDKLRARISEIPTEKPILVHCAGGYRSATGSSILKSKLNGTSEVFDLSEAVTKFQK